MIKDLDMWLIAALVVTGVTIAPYIQPPWILALIVILICGVIYLIQKTKYSAIGITIIAILYGAGAMSLHVFSSTLVIVVLGEAAFRITGGTKRSYIAFIIASTAGSLLVMQYLGYMVPLVAITGVIVAVLLKSALSDRYDALMIECLGVAMTMYLFDEINYQVGLMMLLTAIIIGFSFGYFAYRAKTADLSGLFSGALIGILLIVFADVRWFLVMLTFFIIGSALTRYQFKRKIKLGVAESHGGVRGYFNVFANGLVSVAAAVLYGITGDGIFIALFLGSVASAAADTTASEVGVTGKKPYLITTLKVVPRGTNGGVTIIGTVAAVCAAFAIGMTAFLLNVADLRMVAICTAAGFAGTTADSLVGATLENSGKIGNAGTNLLCTLTGGLFAMMFYLF